MITEIEKNLKRFLKRKATINQSFITKFLITGTIAFSLTACGGGGEGSSSGNNNTPVPPINPENPIEKPTNKPIEDVIGQGDIKNQNIIINGNISNDNISNKPAISALNSIIDNKATIELSGEKTTALQGTANTLLKGKNIEFSITNNKDITLTGKNQTGIKVISLNGKITGINNGNITVVKNIEKDDWDANDKFNEKYVENFAYGMVGLGKDSTIINKGNININGSAIGMYTKEGRAVNDGNINIKNDIYTSEPDKENYKVPIGMVAGEKGSIAINNGTISGEGHELQGMFAYNGGTVINGKTGIININGNFARGIDEGSFNNNIQTILKNEGQINTTGSNNVGIFGLLNSKITNFTTGVINITGDYGTGIKGGNSQITNDGSIIITSNNLSSSLEPEISHSTGIYIGTNDGTASAINNGNIEMNGNKSVGIYAYNGTIENNKKVSITGDMGTGLYISDNGSATNNGDIYIRGNNADGIISGLKSTANNKGNINMIGENNVGMTANKDSSIHNNGKINISSSKKSDSFSVGLGALSDNSKATNEKNGIISIKGNNSNGIYASRGSNIILTNDGNIEMNGDKNYGLFIENSNNNSAINNGQIKISGLIATGMKSSSENNSISNNKLINNGSIEIISNNIENNPNGVQHATGIYLGTNDGTASAINNGNITLIGENNIGMTAENGGTIYNNGDIALIGENNVGMTANKDSSIHNNGKINITSSKKSDSFSVGLGALSDNSKATNEKDGTIFIKGNNSNGIYASRGSNIVLTNNGNIEMNGNKNYGMYIENLNSNSSNIAINNGNINMIGYKNYGMFVENGGTIINEKNGTISVDGKDSYGMVARGENSNAINSGTINIGASASGGMLADAGVISNEGIINIDKSHNLTDEEKNNFAMQAINGGTIKNFGTINTNGNITISSESNYIIGTTKDGNYGKISGKNINLDGNITLDSTIASNDFKDTYILENIIESKNINLSENSKINSNSLLYDAHTEKNNSGNLDGKLTKNENNISDFTSKKYDHLASLFDKSIDSKEFRDTLSDEAKNVLNDVFASTDTKENIEKKFKEISGEEYSNISRQVFDIKDIFKSYDNSIIDTLNNYSFNFNFIGNYNDIESKNNILGYNSKMSGIIGASKLSESLYGVLGYGYSNLDFDNNSEGSIQSIHTGVYKDLKLNSFDLRMGIFGEYNLHKIERNVVNNIAKGDFNSYILGLTTEISQKFGDSLYLKPSLNFDLSYGKYDSFSENGAKGYNLNLDSQNYTSFIPTLEIKAGKIFKSTEIYSIIKYGYEFGHMNKNQNITFKEFGHYYLDNDNIENSQTNINIGTSFKFKNVSLNAELGKEFGHRDSEYIKASFSYTF